MTHVKITPSYFGIILKPSFIFLSDFYLSYFDKEKRIDKKANKAIQLIHVILSKMTTFKAVKNHVLTFIYDLIKLPPNCYSIH